jgi:hypothetical protein
MNFVIIRNQKTDSFTMHATTCRVAIKHYDLDGKSQQYFADAPDSVEKCLAEMVQYAEECGWNEAPKVKICKCAKG